ncbi:MAG: hypothetical protein V5A87_08270 [Candidatus Bipolaricaulota bacterium]|nr:hypothetical protein [Candidatus Bipolaricaulota bacterium]MBS3793086.1 hypothetical protein [Candidatus Bipolaricaulota bacterium]
MSNIFSSTWMVTILVVLNLVLNWGLNRIPEEEKSSAKGKLIKGLMVVITGLLVVSIAFTVMNLL